MIYAPLLSSVINKYRSSPVNEETARQIIPYLVGKSQPAYMMQRVQVALESILYKHAAFTVQVMSMFTYIPPMLLLPVLSRFKQIVIPFLLLFYIQASLTSTTSVALQVVLARSYQSRWFVATAAAEKKHSVIVGRRRAVAGDANANNDNSNNNNKQQQQQQQHDNDDKEKSSNTDEDQHQHVTSYAQRHPNNNYYYYYSNGNRVSSTSKAAYSYYDYNDDDDSYYYRRHHDKSRQRNRLYNYTTQLSDVYWCLLIALGWTIWMIHSIASLRQQHYNTSISNIINSSNNDADGILTNDTTATTNAAMMTMMNSSSLTNADTIRIFRTPYASLLFVRGHVLDVLPNMNHNTSDTPMAPTYTVIIDYVIERQQHVSSPRACTTIKEDDNVATLPTINSDTILQNEFIQIRKHFETTQSNLEVGFGNVELLVLPSDPMCSILRYDYDATILQEKRIERVIAQEQMNRTERRKKRQQQQRLKQQRQQQSNRRGSMMESSSLPTSILTSQEMVDNALSNNNKIKHHDASNSALVQVNKTDHLQDNVAEEDVNYRLDTTHGDDDDDIFGCDMCCCTFCDWNSYDAYQWKRMSFFFSVLLVLASIVGTIHVVSRMDPTKKYIGWITLWIGLLLLFPVAMWIHKVLIACHRWSESEPEKQGYIVQSSTITSYQNGDEPKDMNYNHSHTVPTKPPHPSNAMTLADACMRPSCTDMMEDICDPNCSKHTLTNPMHTSKSLSNTKNPTEFAYLVPEMSGCYFIHYPKKDHRSHRSTEQKTYPRAKKSNRQSQSNNGRQPVHCMNGVVEPSLVVVPTNATVPSGNYDNTERQKGIDMDNENIHDTAPLDVSHLDSAASIVSTSSISSISSNEDPKMKQLSVWNNMIHVVNRMRSHDSDSK
jgi:hypothetical protein